MNFSGTAIFVLALAGLWISIYFCGVYYKWIRPDVFWIPKVCRLGEKTCLSILETPQARLFGTPNALLGVALYAYILLDLFLFPPLAGMILLGAAALASVYLAYSLIFVIKVPCPLCFASHGINLALLLLYIGNIL